MAELSVHESATGPCVVCGKECEGSPYWVGMSHLTWLKIKPYVRHLFPYSEWSKCHLEMKGFFMPPYDKPLCSAICALMRKGHE